MRKLNTTGLIIFAAGIMFILGISIFADARDSPDITRSLPPSPANTFDPLRGGSYVSLGDSVAAGAGLDPLPQTAPEDIRCTRSLHSYPVKISIKYKVEHFDFACSGSKLDNVSSQLDSAYLATTPKLITISVGANDVRWVDFIKSCFEDDCATEQNSALAKSYLAQLRQNLATLIEDIKSRSNGKPPVVVLSGYYNPSSSVCSLIPQVSQYITSEEIEWFEGQTVALNAAIRETANDFSFARFATIDFSGHDICSGDSWIQGPGEAAPFHPNEAGQTAIAEAIIKSL